MQIELAYRPPLAWDALLEFLVGRGAAGVECAKGRRYVRTVALDGYRGWFSAEPIDGRDAIRLDIAPSLETVMPGLLPRIRSLFDLDADPQRIDAHFAQDARLGVLIARRSGLRVPGALDGFELALRAVLGQQVTVKAATTLFGRFAQAFGESAQTPHAELRWYAPQAARVAEASVQTLIDLGLTQRRAQTISTLARVLAEGQFKLEGGVALARTLESFQAIPGIGPWTAQYVAMRALRDPDAFPASDLALMKVLQVTRPAQALAASESWRPWRAYAALHLWQSMKAGG